MARTRWTTAVGLGLALALGCSPKGPVPCAPGSTATCACPGGGQGVQRCAPDGGYEPCLGCGSGSGGPSGSGSAGSSSSGSGGSTGSGGPSGSGSGGSLGGASGGSSGGAASGGGTGGAMCTSDADCAIDECPVKKPGTHFLKCIGPSAPPFPGDTPAPGCGCNTDDDCQCVGYPHCGADHKCWETGCSTDADCRDPNGSFVGGGRVCRPESRSCGCNTDADCGVCDPVDGCTYSPGDCPPCGHQCYHDPFCQ